MFGQNGGGGGGGGAGSGAPPGSYAATDTTRTGPVGHKRTLNL